jgi:50S ribosomal protein L16 3-hydroxylase
MQSHPAQLGAGMIRKVEHIVGDIRWTRRDVAEFLGAYLTEPKPRVRFAQVRRPHSERAFTVAATLHGIALVPAALMLYGNGMVFINGETHRITDRQAMPLRRLADTRRLAGRRMPRAGPVMAMLYRWYRDGYICLTNSDAAA